MRRLLRVGLLITAVAVASVCFGVRPAQALSNLGPDPNDFVPQFPGATFAYGVSSADHEFAAIPQTRVFLYFKNNTGVKTVTVIGGDTCTDRQNSALNNTGGNFWDRPYRPDPPTVPAVPPASWPYFGQDVTRYSVTSGQFTYGVFSDSDTCYRDERAIAFPGTALTFDPNTGLYKTALTAVMVSGWSNAQNHFQLRLSDADGVIGYDAGLSENSASLLRYNRDPAQTTNGYSDYSLPFAPDCTIGASATGSGYWYDDDNDSPPTQPERFWMQLDKYRADNGAYIGKVPLTFIGAASVDPGPGGANTYYVNSGNQQNVRMDFTAESGYKYIWRWNHVFHRNALQFRMPYDSIYYITGCQAPAGTLRPSSVIDKPKITYPDTATFTHYLNVTNFNHNGAVNYTVQRYRNGAAIGGAQNGTYNFTANGQFTVLANAFNSGAGDAGDRICERLTLSAPLGQTLNIINNPSETCTEVLTRPYLTVTNNDVWAGSRFDYANNVCAGQTPRLSNISSWVSGGIGAVGEYGLFGLGAITEFGSANQPGGNRLSFANNPSGGGYGAVTRCMPNYYDTVGATGDAWPGFGALTADMGKKIYFVNGDLVINGNNQIPKGTQVLLVVNGNLSLRGNITYANNYTTQKDISSLWAVAKGNIYVQENVTNLHGLFVAQGTQAAPGKIHTCVQTGGTATYNPMTSVAGRCDQGLDVFGAFLADQIYWQRTRGTAGSGTPAESIQFDPGLYLNSPWTGTGTGALEVQNITELPPVY